MPMVVNQELREVLVLQDKHLVLDRVRIYKLILATAVPAAMSVIPINAARADVLVNQLMGVCVI